MFHLLKDERMLTLWNRKQQMKWNKKSTKMFKKNNISLQSEEAAAQKC